MEVVNRIMMKFIREYKIVLFIILPVTTLVIIRSIGPDRFRPDFRRWAQPSVTRSNILTSQEVKDLPGEKLVINLGVENMESGFPVFNELKIETDNILTKKNLYVLKNHSGPIIISSPGISVSSRIWTLLSQMGYTNIYILTGDIDNEILKFKFRSDTTVKPGF